MTTLEKANVYFNKIQVNYIKAFEYFEKEDYISSETQLKIFKINLDMLEMLIKELGEKTNDY